VEKRRRRMKRRRWLLWRRMWWRGRETGRTKNEERMRDVGNGGVVPKRVGNAFPVHLPVPVYSTVNILLTLLH
jgi:hypothetical protein